MRGRRGRSEPEALGSLLSGVLDDLGMDGVRRVMRVVEHWEPAVGAEIAQHCRPTAIRGDVLEASVDSSVWCQQLQLRIPEILAALRSQMGDDAPTGLWLKVGS